MRFVKHGPRTEGHGDEAGRLCVGRIVAVDRKINDGTGRANRGWLEPTGEMIKPCHCHSIMTCDRTSPVGLGQAKTVAQLDMIVRREVV